MDKRFYSRKNELGLLEELYSSNKFEMLILHGRRRVGKSYLLREFASRHSENTIFFTADKSSEQTNVENFTEELRNHFENAEYTSSFKTWHDVYSFIKNQDSSERLCIIIDEFTYLLFQNPSFDSSLQNAIDRIFKEKNIFLILCGSEVSVIERLLDDVSRPLYGRKTADLKLMPFTYDEAKEFFPNYSNEESIIAYSILGGIPLYLSLFDDKLSIKENVIRNCLKTTSYLYDEVESLLRSELKETSFYKQILLAVNAGNTKFSEICQKIPEESAKIAKYLSVLIDLGIVNKEVPCGESEKNRNTLYSIEDNYFAFWFMFIYKKQSLLNGFISPEKYYEKYLTEENLNTFLGFRFEKICKEFITKKSFKDELSFYPEKIGKWWGTNPVTHSQDEIDIVALDKENVIFAECKWTNAQFDENELKDLFNSTACINRKNKHLMIFSRSGFTEKVKENAKINEIELFEIEDLFLNCNLN